MDQCKPCMLKGNLEKCLETDCNYHSLWMVKEVRRLLENEAVLANTMLESISSILDGKQVNDFELSFPIVRKVWDAVNDEVSTCDLCGKHCGFSTMRIHNIEGESKLLCPTCHKAQLDVNIPAPPREVPE